MKKLAAILMLVMLADGYAFAAQRGTPEYEQLKVLKQKQREEKKVHKAEPSPKTKGFWQREAERSGFAGTGAMFSNAISNAIPLDKMNSKKEA
jgi:hypothetical protein